MRRVPGMPVYTKQAAATYWLYHRLSHEQGGPLSLIMLVLGELLVKALPL